MATTEKETYDEVGEVEVLVSRVEMFIEETFKENHYRHCCRCCRRRSGLGY